VGIPDRREDLMKHQPSVARIFDVVDLPVMNEDESGDFFTKTFGKKSVTLDEEALSLMVRMSGGYPMLMHEVGDAVFWQDTDNQVDITDARQGIFEAARNVGKKYIGAQVATVLRNEIYRSILLRMGQKTPIGVSFTRRELLKEKASDKEYKNLDNFLNKVKKLGIMKAGDAHGECRFVNPLYHLYIWYTAQEQSKSGRNSRKQK